MRSEYRTENGGRRRVEVGSGEDSGRISGVANQFRVVIEGNHIRNEIGANAKNCQSHPSTRNELYGPLGEVDGCGRDRRTSTIDSTTRTSGHGRTNGATSVDVYRVIRYRTPYRMAWVSSVTPSPFAP